MKKLLLISCLAITRITMAGITFEDDFESDVTGGPPGNIEWELSGAMTVTNGAPLETQWLENRSDTGWTFGRLNVPDAALMTLSFDAYFDAALFGDGYMRMGMGGDDGSTINYLDFGPNWDVEKGVGFSLDKRQHIDVVMNMSGVTTNINGTELDHDEFAVFVEGAKVLESTMDQPGSETNTMITSLGMWINAGTAGSRVYLDNVVVRDEPYVIQYPWDTVFDFDFNGIADASVLTDFNGWDIQNQWGFAFAHTNADGGRLVHRPGSTDPEFFVNSQPRKGWNWRGAIHTNGLGRAVMPGETLELKMDYTMFAYTGTATRGGLDFFFTTNGTSVGLNTQPDTASQQYFGEDPDGQMGFRTMQLNWPAWPEGGFGLALDPSEPSAANSGTALNLHTIGVTNLTGGGAADIESIPMNITYSAYKTTNAGVWSVSVEMADENGGVLKTYSDTAWTNQALYDASDIYFAMYAYHNAEDEEGAEIDNFRLRILHEADPVLSPFDQFLADFGIGGQSKTADADADSLNNWGEYVFGGNPTNAADLGTQPVFDAATGDYIFALNGDNSIVAHVVSTPDLVLGPWSTNASIFVSSTNGVLNAYTNAVGTGAVKQFIRLEVD